MKRLWIYGAGGHARVVYDIVNAVGTYSVAGFADDDARRAGQEFFGHTLVTMREFQEASVAANVRSVVIAVGDNHARESLAKRLEKFDSPTVIHPSAVVSPHARIGRGTVVMPGAIIEAQAHIGNYCIINNAAIVGHGSVIGDYCHIGGNAIVCGEAGVGEGSFIGVGSCIPPGKTIGKRCMVCAGSVVTRDFPDGVKMLGNPARVFVGI